MLRGSGIVSVTGVLAFLITIRCLFALVRALWVQLSANRMRKWARLDLVAFGLAVVFLGVAIMRPHEHVFQGLDSSAYRLMAKAFSEGHPFRSVDSTLKEVPEDVRKWLLLDPNEKGRMTRDRSYQIESLESCEIKPFFYPLLPLCMVGMDKLIPGDALDYFVPLAGLIFCIACLAVGISCGGAIGALVFVALFIASPLPVWLFRGCYAETISGILICLSMLPWLVRTPGSAPATFAQIFALGLAVSFHPVALVFALPLFCIVILEDGDKLGQIARYSAAFCCGLAPIVLMTLFVATPYGSIGWQNLRSTIISNASIRPAAFTLGAVSILFLVAWCFRKLVVRLPTLPNPVHYSIKAFLLLMWILPALFAMKYWEGGQGFVVTRGFEDMMDGLGGVLQVSLGLLCMCLLISRKTLRARILLTVVFVTLPLFLYLKGAEYMGLWSQRRLIISLLLVITCGLPAAATLAGEMVKPGALRLARAGTTILVLCVVALANAVPLSFVRNVWPDAPRELVNHGWPAPYLVQYEKGADVWVERMRDRIGARFAISDSYGYSVPLAVGGKTRVVGVSGYRYGFDGLNAVAPWVARKAAKEDVLWITAFRNPGLEEEVILEPEGPREAIALCRARSKTALPAVKEEMKIDAQLLKVRPVQDGDVPVMDKLFDGGILGLRPPWGPGIPIKLPDQTKLPAWWSRQGSGIVGPMPPPGGAVRINIAGVTGRTNAVLTQTLSFSAPWGETETLKLTVSNCLTETSGVLTRQVGGKDDGSRTGIYIIRADTPYSPATEGIRGFNRDLGALLHRIRIEPVTPEP